MRMAWRFALRLLAHDRARLATSVGGIAFALLLMIVQLVFRDALLQSSLELLRQIDADLVVLDEEKVPFLSRDPMPRERLYQALSVDGVEAAYPLWLGLLFWKNLSDGTERPIRVIGFRPGDPVFRNPEIAAAADDLRRPWTALVDRRSRDSYGPLGLGSAQVARRPMEIVGTFPLGTDFESDGNLIVGAATFEKLNPQARIMIELAALAVAPGVDPASLVGPLERALPGDVRVYTKAALLARELDYWKSGTPVSLLLLAGVALGFAVGIVVCYQILYTDVIDHLRELATLKAMGYGEGFLRGSVVAEAWVLSLLGAVPAAALGFAIQRALGAVTGLPMRFSWENPLLVLGLSLAMCTAASLLALRKLSRAEPAELF